MSERKRRTFAEWLDDLLAVFRRHRHYYRPIAAFTYQPVPIGLPMTTVVLACFCHTVDQYAWVSIPGRYKVAELTTPDNAGLLTVAMARKLEEATTAFEAAGEPGADALNWRAASHP